MPELQDVFHEYGEAYQQKHAMSLVQHKAMKAVVDCRTARLGGHVDVCENCGNTEISYNSCRNRHCPKCQTFSKERWIEGRKADLLNTGYFHVVFTVPEELRPVFYQNQVALYNLLFRAAAETLQELAANKKYLGARIGFTSILHTWGQNLSYHPHLHCVVTGGGLNSLNRWTDSGKDFFLPVRVISRLFRGKFLHGLGQAGLTFHVDLKRLENPAGFQQLLDVCYQKEWVAYCKKPFKDAACVVEYLGRYTHRIAISNNRILGVKDGVVSFKWRDYKNQNRWKVMSLSGSEFIRRFLMHVLPPRFMKIRHYGLLACRDKAKRIALCKRLLDMPSYLTDPLETIQLLQKLLGRDPSRCRECGHPIHRQYRGLSPPIPA